MGTPTSPPLWRRVRENYSGREIFLLQLSATSSHWPPPTSRPTSERSFMTFTKQPTLCSLTCQGDHKKRAKYRFASKTLMRILPAPFKGEVEELIEKKAITLDLYEILGKCTWKAVS